MAKKRIKKPADVRAALEAGRLDDAGRRKAVSMGLRLLPEIREIATDVDRVWAEDPASQLALTLLTAIGAPDDLVPELMAAIEVAPARSEIQGLLGDVLSTTGAVGVDAVLARMERPVEPGLAGGLAWALAPGDDPRITAALRRLLVMAPLQVAPHLATRQDLSFLPDLEAILPTISLPANAPREVLEQVHAYLLACRDLGSEDPRLIMLQAALTERARALATQVHDDLRSLEALADRD